MKKMIIILLGVILISACGGGGGSSSVNEDKKVLSSIDQLGIELSVVNVDPDGYGVGIVSEDEDIALDFTGGVPLDTSDINFASDDTIKTALEPVIREFESTLEEIKSNGGSISLIDGDYTSLEGYYSIIFGMGVYKELKPYTTFQTFSNDQVIILTKESCIELERAGISILSFADEGILVMEQSCGIDYIVGMYDRDFILEHSASFIVKKDTNIKAFKYSITGDNLQWFDINNENMVENVETFLYENLDQELDLKTIEDFNSRMVWSKISKIDDSIEGYLRYDGGKGSLKYTGGLPLDTSELNLDSQIELKAELVEGLKDFENNIDTIKSNGGSLFMEFQLMPAIYGHYSIALALLEEVLFTDIINNIDLIYTGEQIIVLTKDTCFQLEKNSIYITLRSDSEIPESIALIHEDCELNFEAYTEDSAPAATQNSIQYKENDLKYAYNYDISEEGIVTFSENLLQ